MLIDFPVLITENIEDHTVHDIFTICKPLSYGLYRDLRRPFRRETEDSRGDAAERHRAQAVFRAQVQAVGVASGKLLLQRRAQLAGDDGPYNMDDLFRREVIGLRQHGNSGWLFVVRTVLCPKLLHLAAALRPELYACEGVDAVSDPYQNHT